MPDENNAVQVQSLINKIKRENSESACTQKLFAHTHKHSHHHHATA